MREAPRFMVYNIPVQSCQHNRLRHRDEPVPATLRTPVQSDCQPTAKELRKDYLEKRNLRNSRNWGLEAHVCYLIFCFVVRCSAGESHKATILIWSLDSATNTLLAIRNDHWALWELGSGSHVSYGRFRSMHVSKQTDGIVKMVPLDWTVFASGICKLGRLHLIWKDKIISNLVPFGWISAFLLRVSWSSPSSLRDEKHSRVTEWRPRWRHFSWIIFSRRFGFFQSFFTVFHNLIKSIY